MHRVSQMKSLNQILGDSANQSAFTQSFSGRAMQRHESPSMIKTRRAAGADRRLRVIADFGPGGIHAGDSLGVETESHRSFPRIR